MMKQLRWTGLAFAALLISGCVRDARIAVSPSLQGAGQRLELTGMGAGERGRFQLGSSSGRFTRSALSKGKWGGFFVRHSGGGSFAVEGPEFGSALQAECDFEEEERNLGVVSVPGLRFAYRCAFSGDGQAARGGLVLEEVPHRPGKLLTGRTRAGEAHLAGVVVDIKAIHDLEGGRAQSGTPLGYRFEVDGREVGAVDLNGIDKTIYAPPPGPEREVVLAASLALAILWDPST